jgi:hypothetical protein
MKKREDREMTDYFDMGREVMKEEGQWMISPLDGTLWVANTEGGSAHVDSVTYGGSHAAAPTSTKRYEGQFTTFRVGPTEIQPPWNNPFSFFPPFSEGRPLDPIPTPVEKKVPKIMKIEPGDRFLDF